MSGAKKDAWAVAGLIGLALALNPFLLFPGKTFLPADILQSMYPWGSDAFRSPHSLWIESIRLEYVFMDFWKKSMAAGQFPLWNPYLGGGVPFLAVGSTALLAPLNFPFLIFPTVDAFNVLRFLQFALAAIFMYAFLRSLALSPLSSFLGAAISTSSLWFLLQDMTIVMRGPLLWTPLVLLLTRLFVLGHSRWYWFALAIAVGAQVLSGSSETALYCAALAGAYGVFLIYQETRPGAGFKAANVQLLLLATAFALGFLIATPQLLPMVEAARLGSRAVLGPGTPVHSAPPWHVLTLLSPNFFGHPSQDDIYTHWGLLYGLQPVMKKIGYLPVSYLDNFYIGIAAFALVCIALGKAQDSSLRFFTIAAFASIAWTMLGPLYGLLVFWVPVFNQISTPDRAIGIVTLCLAILAAYGLERVRNAQADIRVLARRVGKAFLWTSAVLATTLLILHIGLVGTDKAFPDWPARVVAKTQSAALALSRNSPNGEARLQRSLAEIPAFLHQGLLRTSEHFSPLNPDFLIAIFSLAVVGALLLGTGRLRRLPFLLGALALVEGVLGSWRAIPMFDKKDLFPSTAGIQFLEHDSTMYRVAVLSRPPASFEDERRTYFSNVIEPNFLMPYGLQDIRFHGSLTPKRIHDYGNYAAGQDPDADSHRLIFWEDSVSKKLLDLANVKYVVSRPGAATPVGYTKVYDGPDMWIYQSAEAAPRAWLATSYRLAATREDRFRLLLDPGFDPAREIVLEQAPTEAIDRRTDEPGSLNVVDYTPNAVRISTTLRRAAFLVLSDTDYPGWRAKVDGVPRPILRANHFMRVLELGPGKHDVEFRFHPTTLYAGLWVALGALLAAAMVAAFFPAPPVARYRSLNNLPDNSGLVLIDLDDTLIRGDSLFRFLWFCLKRSRRIFPRQFLAFLRSPKTGDTRLLIKAGLLNLVVPTESPENVALLAGEFVDQVLIRLVRPEIAGWLSRVRQANGRVYVVSASPDLWVNPLVARMELDGAICSHLVIDPAAGFLPDSPNCRGAEKARRIREVVDLAAFTQVVGVGNSPQDEPMLSLCSQRVLVV